MNQGPSAFFEGPGIAVNRVFQDVNDLDLPGQALRPSLFWQEGDQQIKQ